MSPDTTYTESATPPPALKTLPPTECNLSSTYDVPLFVHEKGVKMCVCVCVCVSDLLLTPHLL